jgi:hypothetical protein
VQSSARGEKIPSSSYSTELNLGGNCHPLPHLGVAVECYEASTIVLEGVFCTP